MVLKERSSLLKKLKNYAGKKIENLPSGRIN